MIYSFDVFDTCISRSCGDPDNVFYLLASDVIASKEEALIRAFVAERKAAEKKAMEKLKKEAVTLDDIYTFFDLKIFTAFSKDVVKNKEIILEKRILIPIRSVVQEIDKLRKESGNKIIFISDMYLPYEVLWQILFELNILKDNDSLYISGCIGLSKRTGKLFDYVQETEKIDISKWKHHGDHIYSDYLVPKRKGIKATLIKTEYTNYESVWKNDSKFSIAPLSISLFSGIIRSIRLKYANSADIKFITNYVAPLLIPFVVSLLKDASQKGIQRLYFASRDAYILYIIAKEFNSVFPDIELCYLHISRTVLYPVFVNDKPKERLLYILKLNPEIIPKRMLEMLEYTDLEIEEISHFIDIEKKVSVNDFDLDFFVDKLLEGDNYKKLLNRCKEKRDLLISYLQQERFNTETQDKVGLVDIGWRCTCQEMLSGIANSNVTYYYWGVTKERMNINRTGSFITSVFWEDFHTFRFIDPYSKVRKIIEYYICDNTEGTTLGYKPDADNLISPILAKSQESSEVKNKVSLNHEILKDISRLYIQYPILIKDAEIIFKSCSIKVLYLFAQYPSPDILKFLARKSWNDSFIWDGKTPFIFKLYPWTIFYLGILVILKLFHINKVSNYRWIWIDASLIYTYGKFGKWLVSCKRYFLTRTNLMTNIKIFIFKIYPRNK